MPTYEYKCQKCGHHFEVSQSMNDAKLTDCPLEECEGSVKRLLGTGAGIIFKGSGFYQTDYRSDSYKEGAKKAETAAKGESSGSGDSSKPSSPGESGSKKTESKPAPAAAAPAASSKD